MANKLGTVDIPEDLAVGIRIFKRLEGERKAAKLIEDAHDAYLKVIRTVIEKDSAIQNEVAKELAPAPAKRVKPSDKTTVVAA